MALSPLDVTKGLFEIEISSGALGSSGAIPSDMGNLKEYDRETVVLFRVHHSLCDGVSMAAAVGDLSDEAAQLKDKILQERKNRMRKHDGNQAYHFFSSVARSLLFMLWFVFTIIHALVIQTWKIIVSSNPFDPILARNKVSVVQRSIAWRNIASVDDMKRAAKATTKRTTINDIAVACVTHAIKKQLEEHSRNMGNDAAIRIPQSVNITVPVHLTGGILKPGEQLGNKIGCFVSTIELNRSEKQTARDRLRLISKVLQREKNLPSPLISWKMAKIFTDYTPVWCTKYALRKCSANSVAVVSNVRGFPIRVHWLGRRVAHICAFLPLPPGIPIGIVVASYDGIISFGLNSDKRAVPDPDKFCDWMLEEYKRICDGQ